ALQAQEPGPAKKSDLEAAAQRLVSLLAKGEFEKATAGFDATMRKVLPADALKKGWQKTCDEAGAFKKQLGTRQEKSGNYDIVYAACEMAEKKVDAGVVFDKDGNITGLQFRPAAKPRPAGTEEIWEGKLKAGAVEIRLVFH